MCDKLFPCLYPFETCRICTSMIMKKAGHCAVPSNPTWKCKSIFQASLNDFTSDHEVKLLLQFHIDLWVILVNKYSVETMKTFFISTLSKTVKYVLQWWMKKVWPEFCPFRTYLRVQHNISDIFERFSINSCNKKMKTQETFKKNSGYMNVQHVTNDFLIFTLSKTCQIFTSVMNEKSLTWILSLQNLFEGAQ